MNEEDKKLEEVEEEGQPQPTEDNQSAEDTQAPAVAEQSEPAPENNPEEPPFPASEPEPAPVPQPEAAPQPAEKMIPQSEVNELIGRTRQEAREKAMSEGRSQALKELVERYGLDNEDGLNTLFGDGQRYQALNDEYGSQAMRLKELEAENVLLKSGVDRSRFDDVIAILEHNHMQVTPETVEQMKLTHPEWTANSAQISPVQEADGLYPEQPVEKPSVVRKLGGEPSEAQKTSMEEDEKAQALKLLGL